MAFIFYQELEFVVPNNVNEENYINYKSYKNKQESSLPCFFSLHFYNVIIIIIALSILFIDNLFNLEFTNLIGSGAKIVLIFWIPKFAIETYKYLTYIKDEKKFNKKINSILQNTSSFAEFHRSYNDEIKTSTFGKFLIKLFLKKDSNHFKKINDNEYVLKIKAQEYLNTNKKNETETVKWLIGEGITESKALSFVKMEKFKILDEKKSLKRQTIYSGLFIFLIGLILTIFNTGYYWYGAIIGGIIQLVRGLDMSNE